MCPYAKDDEIRTRVLLRRPGHGDISDVMETRYPPPCSLPPFHIRLGPQRPRRRPDDCGKSCIMPNMTPHVSQRTHIRIAVAPAAKARPSTGTTLTTEAERDSDYHRAQHPHAQVATAGGRSGPVPVPSRATDWTRAPHTDRIRRAEWGCLLSGLRLDTRPTLSQSDHPTLAVGGVCLYAKRPRPPLVGDQSSFKHTPPFIGPLPICQSTVWFACAGVRALFESVFKVDLRV